MEQIAIIISTVRQRAEPNSRDMIMLTYDEITEKTERMIQRNMKRAKAHHVNGRYDSFDICRSLATGALLLWDSLTVGFQKSGDYDRLERMTEVTE